MCYDEGKMLKKRRDLYDPKISCNMSLRRSIVEALDKEGLPRSHVVERLVETFLLNSDSIKKQLARELTDLKERFRRINIELICDIKEDVSEEKVNKK